MATPDAAGSFQAEAARSAREIQPFEEHSHAGASPQTEVIVQGQSVTRSQKLFHTLH